MTVKGKEEERTVLDILLGALLTLGGKLGYDLISKQVGDHLKDKLDNKIKAKLTDKDNVRGRFFSNLARMDRAKSANLEGYLDQAQNENFEGDFMERICSIPYDKDIGWRAEMDWLSESTDYAQFKRRLLRLKQDNANQWVKQVIDDGKKLKTAAGKGFIRAKTATQDAFGAVGAGTGKFAGSTIGELNEYFIRREEARRRKRPLHVRIARFLGIKD
jgi:hypothetical protein